MNREREHLKTAKIKFGTLFEVSSRSKFRPGPRVDMVLEPHSSTYFSSITTSTDGRDRLILNPFAIGTSGPNVVSSILDEHIGLLQALNGISIGLEMNSLKLNLLTIFRFWRYSHMPAIVIRYIEEPEDKFIR